MKTAKIADEVHARLKELAVGCSISDVIEDLLKNGNKRTDLDIVLEQINMRFDILDAHTQGKVAIPPDYAGEQAVNDRTGFGMAYPSPFNMTDDIGTPETKQEKFERIRKEQEELEKKRKHSILHPEESSQEDGWGC